MIQPQMPNQQPQLVEDLKPLDNANLTPIERVQSFQYSEKRSCCCGGVTGTFTAPGLEYKYNLNSKGRYKMFENEQYLGDLTPNCFQCICPGSTYRAQNGDIIQSKYTLKDRLWQSRKKGGLYQRYYFKRLVKNENFCCGMYSRKGCCGGIFKLLCCRKKKGCCQGKSCGGKQTCCVSSIKYKGESVVPGLCCGRKVYDKSHTLENILWIDPRCCGLCPQKVEVELHPQMNYEDRITALAASMLH